MSLREDTSPGWLGVYYGHMSSKLIFVIPSLLALVLSMAGTELVMAEVSAVPVERRIDSSNVVAPDSCPTFTRTLLRGATDATTNGEVTRLQQFLGISPTTGWFGTLTEAAVGRWQVAEGLLPTSATVRDGLGVVGPKTRARMGEGCAPKASLRPEASFAAEAHDAVFLRNGIHYCDFSGPGCGSFWVHVTATNTRSITLVDFDLYNPIKAGEKSGEITYDETTGKYSGAIDLDRIRAANANIEDAAAAYLKEVTVDKGVWRASVGAMANGSAYLALVDTTSGALLDFDIFTPKSVAWVRDANNGWEPASGRRVYGTSQVPNLTLELWTYTTSQDEKKVYEAPLRVSRNRWSHRISADVPDDQVYELYLRTGDTLVYKTLYRLSR